MELNEDDTVLGENPIRGDKDIGIGLCPSFCNDLYTPLYVI